MAANGCLTQAWKPSIATQDPLICADKPFFMDLSHTLTLIAMDQKIPVWIVLNPEDEQEDTKYFGNWTYTLECPIEQEDFPINLLFGCIEDTLYP